MLMLPQIAARIFDVPLMIAEPKAAAILAGIGGQMVPGGFVLDGVRPVDHVAFAGGRPSMGRLGDPLGRRADQDGYGERVLDKIGNVAVIPIEGTLVHKGKWYGSYSGDTSYEGVQSLVSRARRDQSVKGVVFEVDSYGGEAAGAFDTADMIAALSAEKPTLSILTDFAYSAGYLMASAARRIVMPETGGVGSIGVIVLHADFSRKLENEGIKVTLIASGAHKTDGQPVIPLPDNVRAEIKAQVDRGRDLFAAKVAAYRGPRLTKEAALATEAAAYRGEDAVAAGLADGVMRPTEAFDAFVAAINRAGRP